MAYYYGMRLRPFGIGCQPMKGLVACVSDSVVIKGYWDIVEYDRALTEEECEHYSMDFIKEVK